MGIFGGPDLPPQPKEPDLPTPADTSGVEARRRDRQRAAIASRFAGASSVGALASSTTKKDLLGT